MARGRSARIKRIRRGMGRAPGAVATVIDSQSVKAAETVGRDSRGYDAAKKINGRKRHLVVDTKGLPLFVMVTPADMTDRDAAKEVLFRLRLMHPEITIVWADSAYAGQLVTWAKKYLDLEVPGPDGQDGEPAQERGRLRCPAPPLGGREIAGLGQARPQTRPGLRAAHPALRNLDHLGRDHPYDQAHHPPPIPPGQPTSPQRAHPGLTRTPPPPAPSWSHSSALPRLVPGEAASLPLHQNDRDGCTRRGCELREAAPPRG